MKTAIRYLPEDHFNSHARNPINILIDTEGTKTLGKDIPKVYHQISIADGHRILEHFCGDEHCLFCGSHGIVEHDEEIYIPADCCVIKGDEEDYIEQF